MVKHYEKGQVADFYAGKSVFITGGTGFLGKVIIEKILYCCPDVDKIYTLVREKKGFNIEQRLQSFLDGPIFDRIRKEKTEVLKKIVPIHGDVDLPQLNLTPHDEKMLLDKISIVIHSAATVNFNQSIKSAYKTNVEGTDNILSLCHRMKRIEILVHISTAYSNTTERVLEEKLYPSPLPMELDQIKEFIYNYEDGAERKDPKLLFGRPNSYTFTKYLAEMAVHTKRGRIPAVIVRPSIVAASMSEPTPGWVDSWNGATGLLYVIGKGFCRALFSNKQNIIDIIPVDYVANLIVVAAATCLNPNETKVLHCCSSETNPITHYNLAKTFSEKFVKKRYNDVPVPFCLMMGHRWLTYLIIFFMEIMPAYLADACMLLLRRPTKFIKIQTKVSAIRNAHSYFTSNSWILQIKETKKLYSSLSPEDAAKFPFDPTAICWPEYLKNYSSGIIKYLEVKK